MMKYCIRPIAVVLVVLLIQIMNIQTQEIKNVLFMIRVISSNEFGAYHIFELIDYCQCLCYHFTEVIMIYSFHRS